MNMTDQNDIKALNEIIEYFYGKLNNIMGTVTGEKYYSWIQSLRKVYIGVIKDAQQDEDHQGN